MSCICLIGLKQREAEIQIPVDSAANSCPREAANAPGEPRTARSIEKGAPHHVARDRQTDPVRIQMSSAPEMLHRTHRENSAEAAKPEAIRRQDQPKARIIGGRLS